MTRTILTVSLLGLLALPAFGQSPFSAPYDSAQAGPQGPAVPGTLDAPDGVNLLLNGGFEANGGAGTSTFSDWTVFDVLGSLGGIPSTFGSVVAQTGITAPISGTMVDAPTEGTFAAMADSNGPSAKLIYQDFVVPPGGGTVSCDVYVNDQNGTFINAGTLDWESVANQHARLDIMDPAAPVDDVGVGVLMNLFLTSPGDPSVQAYQTVMGDLAPFAGQTVRLRAAEVDNQFFQNFGIDNCILIGGVVTPINEVPTLNSIGLAVLILLIAGLGLVGVRRFGSERS